MKLTETKFNEVLKQEKPVLIDFYADWCGPCKMQAPILEQVSQALEGQAIVGKVNVDEERNLARQYGIMSIPTLIVFKDGKEVNRISGLAQKDRLISMVNAVK